VWAGEAGSGSKPRVARNPAGYPGTVLYDHLDAENRIIDKDYAHYNTANVVYSPMLLTPATLNLYAHTIREADRTAARILDRALGIPRKGEEKASADSSGARMVPIADAKTAKRQAG